MLLQMRLRLSVMMFFEYFIWGVWYVTLGTWLGQQLHFSGTEIGLAAGTTALGAMLSPFLVGLMADEWFATQRLLAALHGVGGVLLWVASTQSKFGPMSGFRSNSRARHCGLDRGWIAHRVSAC